MTILIAWLVAVVAAGLILGIVGFGLAGQLSRLRGEITTTMADVQPRAVSLVAQLPRRPSVGRHSTERQVNTAG